MKKMTIRTLVKNYSRYPIDIVWENARDLEHVAFLHARTNKEFHLLYASPDPSAKYEYEVMIYRAKRRFYCFTFRAFGFRRIVGEHNIYQLEYIPIFGITNVLNSVLRKNDDPTFPTVMLDEVITEVPAVLRFFQNMISSALQRHAAIQCSEDEAYRARRLLLQKKGIQLPSRLFSESHLSKLCHHFTEHVSGEIQLPI